MGRITVGIPTFNRPEAVSRLIQQLKREPWNTCAVLVVDDSTDNRTEKELAGLVPRYIRHPRNLGYPQSFLRLLSECKTEYLMVMADDDLLVDDGFPALLDLLETGPTFVAPQWLQHGVPFREAKKTERVHLDQLMACAAHAPGLVYRVDRCTPHIGFVEQRLRQGCEFTSVYPQATLCLSLLLAGEPCWWLSAPTAKEGSALPSGINDVSGDHYSSYRSRLKQAAALDSMISSVVPQALAQPLQASTSLFFVERILASCPPETRSRFMSRAAKRLLSNVKSPLRGIRRMLQAASTNPR